MHIFVFACRLAVMSVTVHCLQSQAFESFLSLKRAGPDDAMNCFTQMVHTLLDLAQ